MGQESFKTYEYEDEWGRAYTVRFRTGRYESNGRLYADCDCLDEESGEWVAYAPITVNLWAPIDGDDYAYLDTNNSKHLCDWLVAHGLVALTLRTARSGFCLYTEGRFSTEFLSSAAGTRWWEV